MARIICDFYSKGAKQIWGDDPKSEFNQKIHAVNNMYAWLYEKGFLEKVSFQYKDMENGVYFALNAKDLEPYRDEMINSGVQGAGLAVSHIFDVQYKPCEYSGVIQLGWMMGSYRSVDGMVGRSWECDLVKNLNVENCYEVCKVRDEEGVRAAVDKLFSYFDWPVIEKKPELDSQIKAAASKSSIAPAKDNPQKEKHPEI